MNPTSLPLPFSSPLTNFFIEKFLILSLLYIGVNNTDMFDNVGAHVCDSPAAAVNSNPASGPFNSL